MDIRSIQNLAQKTSNSISEAFRCSNRVLEAMQSFTEQLSKPLENESIKELLADGASNFDADSWNRLSDLASLNSTAVRSQTLPKVAKSDADAESNSEWLNAAGMDKKEVKKYQNNQMNHFNSSALQEQRRMPTKPHKAKLNKSAAMFQRVSKKRQASPATDQLQIQSTWEKGQNRLLTAIESSSKDLQRQQRRSASLSVVPPGYNIESGRSTQQLPRGKAQLKPKKKTKTKKAKQKEQQQQNFHSIEGPLSRGDSFSSRPDGSKISSASPKQPQRMPRNKRQKEAACLQTVESLLQLIKQVLAHPSLASAYFQMVRKSVKELGNFLEYYQSETTRPFEMTYLDQLQTVSKAILEDKTLTSVVHHMQKLEEILQTMQQQLQFFLQAEDILPAIDNNIRMSFFSEYSYMVLEDFSKLASNVTVHESSRAYIVCHMNVLLSLMRFFYQNHHMFAGDARLLTSCLHGLEKLASDYSKNIVYRLKSQIRDVGSDLTNLCEFLIGESHQQLDVELTKQDCSRSSRSHVSWEAQSDLRKSPASCWTKSTVGSELSVGRQPMDAHSKGFSSAAEEPSPFHSLNASVEQMCCHLKRLVELPNDADSYDAEGSRLAKSIQRFFRSCEKSHIRVESSFRNKLETLRFKCDACELRSLSFEFFCALLSDTLLFQQSLTKKQQGSAQTVGNQPATCEGGSPDANSKFRSEVITLLSLISSIVCDLYLTVCSPGENVFTDGFQSELRKLVVLVDRRGAVLLDTAKKRQLRQSLLKLIGHMKIGGTKMSQTAMETLIRLLLEIRLHLDRESFGSSQQVWEVEKCVPFSMLTKYLGLRNSRVTSFRAWIQDTQQLRKLVNPFSKDPAVLRVERQCKCLVTIEDQPSGMRRKHNVMRQKCCQLYVDLGASQGNHTACIRLLNNVLETKFLKMEPYEATVHVVIQL